MTKEEQEALDKAFDKAGQNAYFGNGFKAGLEFAKNQKRSEKEQALFDYLSQEADWTPSSTQISDIFHLIEKK